MEGEVDFDHTTDQVDINDEEYDSLIPDENVNPQEFDTSLRRRFGNRWRGARDSLRNMFKRRNPGRSVPEYLQMVELGPIPEAPNEEWQQEIQDQMNESIDKEPDDYERIKEIFPNCDLKKAQIMFTEDPEYGREIIVARLSRANAKVYVIKDINGDYFKDKNIPPTLKEAIGSTNLRITKEMNNKNIESIVRGLNALPKAVGGTGKLEETEAEVEKLKTKLIDRNVDFNKMYNELKDKYDATTKELNETKDRTEQMLDSIADLENELEEEKGNTKRTKELTKEKLALEKAHADMTKRAQAAEDKLKALETKSKLLKTTHENDPLQKELNEKTKVIQAITEERESLKNLLEQQVKATDEKQRLLEVAAEQDKENRRTIGGIQDELIRQMEITKGNDAESIKKAAEARIKDLTERLIKQKEKHKEEAKILLREGNDAIVERNTARKKFEQAINDLGISWAHAEVLQTTIDGALEERAQLLKEINTKEEQLRQKTQAIEDLERQIDQTKAVMQDEALTEEQREAAQKDFEELQERVAELQGQKEKLETELGITTKEKIKRALLKYGLPVAFAVAVSSVVGVILSGLKGVGNGVKKVGKGLADMGKRMAASIPGLLGSVIGFALRAGGELLKFVGNNIWILVVAIGMVLMKKITEKKK